MADIQAVIFDAFGTIVQIGNARHPYRKILKHGKAQGRRISSGDVEKIMCNPLDLKQAAAYFGITVEPAHMAEITSDLNDELASITAFKDAEACIATLKSEGIKVGACSNLAMPYGAIVRRIFPDLDAYGFSFAENVMKPDPRIYQAVLSELDVDASSTWMIGDSQRCDREGPMALGIRGHYLRRNGLLESGDFAELTAFAETVLDFKKSYQC